MDGDEENEACFADSGKNTLWNCIYCLSLSNKGRESPEILLKTCSVNYEIKNETAEHSDLQILTHIQLNTAQMLDI